MRDKKNIIHLYLEGKRKRSIALAKKARNTTDKYINEFELSRKTDLRNLPITEVILKASSYKKRVGRNKALTQEMMEQLRYFIKGNEWKRIHYMGKWFCPFCINLCQHENSSRLFICTERLIT
ncbi:MULTISPECIES: hypothetical protein [Bacillus]|uniref:hypothetical protein n=1 Tax=Bacillus TaxID=1386 RepID=UPI000BB8AD7A|nr:MULTISPECIES: hypothetical protein [Bacillus]